MKNAHEGMATPRGLPVWTILLGVGHVMPLILLLVGAGLPAWLALGCGIVTRVLLAVRFQQPILSALLHPVGIAATLFIQWTALARSALGRTNAWRGREYPAA